MKKILERLFAVLGLLYALKDYALSLLFARVVAGHVLTRQILAYLKDTGHYEIKVMWMLNHYAHEWSEVVVREEPELAGLNSILLGPLGVILCVTESSGVGRDLSAEILVPRWLDADELLFTAMEHCANYGKHSPFWSVASTTTTILRGRKDRQINTAYAHKPSRHMRRDQTSELIVEIVRNEAPPDPALMFFESPLVKECVEDASRWARSRKWYDDRAVPWSRGYLFYGPPGTGKSAMAKHLSLKLKAPLFLVDLASMSNEDFHEAMTEEMSFSGACRVVLIEDIDAVFHGRRNVVEDPTKSLVTFDSFLNSLSGVGSSHGNLIVLTTNFPEHVDPALAQLGLDPNGVPSRPGRIDRAFEFGWLDLDSKKFFVSKFLDGYPEKQKQVLDEYADKNVSVAVFQEVCIREAMESYWSGGRFEDLEPTKPRVIPRFREKPPV